MRQINRKSTKLRERHSQSWMCKLHKLPRWTAACWNNPNFKVIKSQKVFMKEVISKWRRFDSNPFGLITLKVWCYSWDHLCRLYEPFCDSPACQRNEPSPSWVLARFWSTGSQFADMRFVIYLLLTFSSVVLHALKKCEKVSVCKCSTDEGVIDLSRLAGVGSNIPRSEFKLTINLK